MILKKLSLILIVFLTATNLTAAEKINSNEHQLSFFSGNFDFSDDKQSA